MPKIRYRPPDQEIINQMLSENGTYVLTVHNRHIVKCEKSVALPTVKTANVKTLVEEDTEEEDKPTRSRGRSAVKK